MTQAPPPPHEAVERLEELAKAATPGPWEVQDGCSWRRIGTPGHNGNVLCPSTYSRDDRHPDLTAGRGEDLYANLRFIAAANPQTILQLIAHLRQVEEREAVMREALEFYADYQPDPNAGPWGLTSNDFGARAIAALTHSPETDGEG